MAHECADCARTCTCPAADDLGLVARASECHGCGCVEYETAWWDDDDDHGESLCPNCNHWRDDDNLCPCEADDDDPMLVYGDDP